MIESGRPWRATEIIDSVYRVVGLSQPRGHSAVGNGCGGLGVGGSRSMRDLTAVRRGSTRIFDGPDRELLSRAALSRGADSLAREHAERALGRAKTERDRGMREILLARAFDGRHSATALLRCTCAPRDILPSIADWLELRAAGATSDASRRQRNYAESVE